MTLSEIISKFRLSYKQITVENGLLFGIDKNGQKQQLGYKNHDKSWEIVF